MKKLLLFALVTGTGILAHAQHAITSVIPVNAPAGHGTPDRSIDTITTYLDRATGFYNLNAGVVGYVLGTSNVSTETGCHYDNVGAAQVTELMVYFVHKTVMDSVADNVTGKVYACGADSMPTTLLGSGQVSIATADVSGFPTFIPISNYSAQSGGFFVSIDYSGINDTIVINSTNPTNASGGPDGANEKRVRQNTQLGWMRAADIWTIGGTAYNADALIIPIVNIGAAGVTEINDISLNSIYPCPANETAQLTFGVKQPQDVTVEIYSTSGQIVQSTTLHASGATTLDLNVSEWNAGIYYYVLRSATTQVGSKFEVIK